MKRPSLKLFKKICELKAGNITEIAKALGDVTRATIYTWMKDELFKQAFDDVKESLIDLTESQLLNLIKGVPKFKEDENGNKIFEGWKTVPSESSIQFFLKTQGKKRGYIEKTEIENKFPEGTETTIIIKAHE